MTSRDFCFWLQGFFELGGAGDLPAAGPEAMTPKQVATVKAHLALVFIHEIDPAAGGPAEQAKLDEAHAGKPTHEHPNFPGIGPTIGDPDGPGGIKYRC